MPNKAISLDRLKDYDVKLKDLASLWNKSTSYSLNDIVSFKGTKLKCITAGISSNTTLDLNTAVGNQITDGTVVWEILDDSSGASEELYSSNTWLDADTNLTLSSAVTPYDFIIIKVDYSLDGTNIEISKTVIATNDLNTNISLTLNRNSTQYCVVEGQFTSSTVFAVDALELTGFTKFRINKIIGVIGGGGSSGGDTPATSAQIQSLF